MFGVTVEIPAGGLSDRYGHRTNIIIFAILNLLGVVLFTFSTTVPAFIISVMIWRGSGSFLSGSFEALVHESLNVINAKDDYQKYISKVSGLSLFATAISALIGGYMWQINNLMVFWAQIPFYLCTLILSFRLTNFQQDSTRGEGYIKSLKDGSKSIFISNLTPVILSLFGVMILYDLFHQILNASLRIAAGMNSIEMSYVSVGVLMFSSLCSLTYSRFKHLHKNLESNIKFLSIFYLIINLFSYSTNKLIIGSSHVLRDGPGVILDNVNIEKINKEVSSKHRSTAISSYSFIKSIPYAVLAIPLGKGIDYIGINKLAFYLSIFSIMVYVVLNILFRNKAAKPSIGV